MSSQRRKECEENRAAIRPIIKIIILCGDIEIPLRDDGVSGPLSLEKPPKKDGKFRALLPYRANFGDEKLKEHILNCKNNASYMSPKIQNEIIVHLWSAYTKKKNKK